MNEADSIARLTDKEKECLRLWLAHSTAKEIAIGLGVSHHAVEKRLKSARAKLGASSSLEAARMLAAVEAGDGYHRTACGASDLASAAQRDRIGGLDAVARAGTPGSFLRPRYLVPGVATMSLFLAAALAAAMQDNPAPAPTAAVPQVVAVKAFGPGRSGTEADLRGIFDGLDRDRSGFIDTAEQAMLKVAQVTRSGPRNAAPVGALSMFDSDKDGRISFAEFSRGIAAPQLP